MPYQIKKQGNEFCVVKKDDGKKIACHKSQDKAKAQLRALYASEGHEGVDLENLMLAAENDGEVIKSTAHESLAFEAKHIENADGLPEADVVIIRPGEGSNRRFYSREALQDAVARDFWGNDGKGTPMFVDHGDKLMPRKRKVMDLMATIRPGATYIGQEGEVRAKVQFVREDFAKFAKNAGKAIGLSAVHEFMGQRFRGNDHHYHERVDKLVAPISVDFVAFPAQGGEIAQFLSASESEDDVDWSQVDQELLNKHRPDLVKEILATAAESDDPGDDVPDPQPPAPQDPPVPPAPNPGVVTLETVRGIVQEAVEKVHSDYRERDEKRAQAKAEISAHLAKSGLNDKIKGRLMTAFEGVEEYDKGAVQAAIDGAFDEVRSQSGLRGPQVLGLGNSVAQEDDETPTDPATLKRAALPTFSALNQRMAYKPRNYTKGDGQQAGKAN